MSFSVLSLTNIIEAIPRKVRKIIYASLFLFLFFIVGAKPIFLQAIYEIDGFTSKHVAFSLFIVCIWSFFLFLTAAPLGSFTVLTASYFLGPIGGWVQFLSLCLASAVLYYWLSPPKNHESYQEFLGNEKLVKTLTALKKYPLLTVGFLRVFPIIPSCACVLACVGLKISGKHILVGTLLFGWMRPVSLAYIGSQIPNIQALISKIW